MKPPEHRKISPQQFLTKLNPLAKKSIHNPTTIEFRFKTLTNIRRTNHFLNAFFHISHKTKTSKPLHKIFQSISIFDILFH